MKRKTLLFGICGIGRGHTYRQLPIIEYFNTKDTKIGIFAFGESYSFYKERFSKSNNIKVFRVNVPWIHGSINGIDYHKTAVEPVNNNSFIKQNYQSMHDVLEFLGTPDLVISDYEPSSAQLAYALNSKFITIDQQSKFFYKGYPEINGLSAQEEISRLGLFFPRADKRIAVSFYKPPTSETVKNFNVEIVPPIIRSEIVNKCINRDDFSNSKQVLLYLSPYSPFIQNSSEVLKLLSEFKDFDFKLWVSKISDFKRVNSLPKNVELYFHGDGRFTDQLIESAAAISTSGHTFISEAMYLFKPVYTVPLNTFDQRYCAHVVAENGFGESGSRLESDMLNKFLSNIQKYRNNILEDSDSVLLNNRTGENQIFSLIEKELTA